jgi:hypothetical protein
LGFDAGVGYWFGGAGGVELQATFNWWSGEFAYTTAQSASGRLGTPQASLGIHSGFTLTAGASDIRSSIVGASRFTTIDAQASAIGEVGGSVTWSQAYNYMDLNGDGQFGNHGYSEPLRDAYVDPVFHRTVDSLSVNAGAGFGLPTAVNAGISHGMADTNELVVIDVYTPIRTVTSAYQMAWEWLWGD